MVKSVLHRCVQPMHPHNQNAESQNTYSITKCHQQLLPASRVAWRPAPRSHMPGIIKIRAGKVQRPPALRLIDPIHQGHQARTPWVIGLTEQVLLLNTSIGDLAKHDANLVMQILLARFDATPLNELAGYTSTSRQMSATP